MDHILNMIERARAVNQNSPPPPPEPTEKAQICFHYIQPHPSLVVRFATVKKARKEHEKLLKAWREWHLDKFGASPKKIIAERIHHVAGDMFVADVDLATISAIMLVEHPVRDKFIPVS